MEAAKRSLISWWNAPQVKYERDGKVDYVLMSTHTKTAAAQNGQAATKFPFQPFDGRTHKDNCRLQLQSCVDGVGVEQDNNVAFTRFGSFSLACFPHHHWPIVVVFVHPFTGAAPSPFTLRRTPSATRALAILHTTRRSFRDPFALAQILLLCRSPPCPPPSRTLCCTI